MTKPILILVLGTLLATWVEGNAGPTVEQTVVETVAAR